MSDEQQPMDDVTVKVGAGETAPVAIVPDESAVAAAAVPTVGQQLRAAREAANLTLAAVAQSLKFSPRQIELLEADDYATLPGNTIVRGFVRSYARLVKIPPENLMHMLDELSLSAPAEVRPPDNMGIAAQPGEARSFSFAASAAIVISVAALLLGLWHYFGPIMIAPVVAPESASQPAPVEPQAVPLQPDAAVPAPTVAPLEPAPAVPSAETPAPVAVPPRNAQAGAELLFVFAGRSWLEVSDGAKQKLYTGENLAGSRLTLNGKPPFDIVVGNAARVKLTYGGREIDLKPHTRAEVARLTLEK